MSPMPLCRCGCGEPLPANRKKIGQGFLWGHQGRTHPFGAQCSVPGCDRPVEAKGLCHGHTEQKRRTGREPTEPLRALPPLWERFMAKVEVTTEGHWLWTGATDGAGRYGSFGIDGKVYRAHRVAWEQLVGPIPEGLVIDHLCRVTLCVNPKHLQVTTQIVNVFRGNAPPSVNVRKTHCKRGHEFTPENTKMLKSGGRLCLACQQLPEIRERARQRVRESAARRRARDKAAR